MAHFNYIGTYRHLLVNYLLEAAITIGYYLWVSTLNLNTKRYSYVIWQFYYRV